VKVLRFHPLYPADGPQALLRLGNPAPYLFIYLNRNKYPHII
jgi:hypothetical protein